MKNNITNFIVTITSILRLVIRKRASVCTVLCITYGPFVVHMVTINPLRALHNQCLGPHLTREQKQAWE